MQLIPPKGLGEPFATFSMPASSISAISHLLGNYGTFLKLRLFVLCFELYDRAYDRWYHCRSLDQRTDHLKSFALFHRTPQVLHHQVLCLSSHFGDDNVWLHGLELIY